MTHTDLLTTFTYQVKLNNLHLVYKPTAVQLLSIPNTITIAYKDVFNDDLGKINKSKRLRLSTTQKLASYTI